MGSGFSLPACAGTCFAKMTGGQTIPASTTPHEILRQTAECIRYKTGNNAGDCQACRNQVPPSPHDGIVGIIP